MRTLPRCTMLSKTNQNCILFWNIFREENLLIISEFTVKIRKQHIISPQLYMYSGRLTSEAVRFYAAEIVLILEYLHSKGIAHRDLKVY